MPNQFDCHSYKTKTDRDPIDCYDRVSGTK